MPTYTAVRWDNEFPASILKNGGFFLFATPKSEVLHTLQSWWVISYGKVGEAPQFICSTLLIHATTLAYLDSAAGQKEICTEYKTTAQEK